MSFKNFPTKEALSFIKVFIFCFAVVFLAINFGTAKKIFNYKIVYGPAANFSVQSAAVEEAVFIEKPDSIEIPKIQVVAPLVFLQDSEKDLFSQALDRGVVHYPDSSLPGEEGQAIFLGHSAPIGWPKIKHDWVFSDLNDLVPGDEIVIYFNNQKYAYYVEEKSILDKGGDLPEVSADGLILLTCWPPGADQKRMAVIAH